MDIELDNQSGLIRVRPTTFAPTFDLRPYEEFDYPGLPQLADLIRQELKRAAEHEGVSPFDRESFEPILSSVASRIDSEGRYFSKGDQTPISPDPVNFKHFTVTDGWVLFARPRSQHVVLRDIDRLRDAARDVARPIGALAERIVTPPSTTTKSWSPLGDRVGSPSGHGDGGLTEEVVSSFDVFFPKPFNDDQVEIVGRLKHADGLVVQGPPGTGKTHTIANIICHAMATGERILVTSRGEAALTVLKEQLPPEVQQLAIAILSNERQGLRQVENAIREIQSVVEATRPEQRLDSIRRMESEIELLRNETLVIDRELESIASAHLSKMGPRDETPAQLAQQVILEKEVHRWFTDRPAQFVSETPLEESQIVTLRNARLKAGRLLDHIDAALPSQADLPAPSAVRRWHEDLLAARKLGESASTGPVPSIRVTPETAERSLGLADALDALAATAPKALNVEWIEPLHRYALRGEDNPWLVLLSERLMEWTQLDAQRVELARRSVELPAGLLANKDALAAISRAAKGERLWPLIAVGKGAAKTLIGAIQLDGASVQEDDRAGWGHVASVIIHIARRQQLAARWRAFVQELGGPREENPKLQIESARRVFLAAENARIHSSLLATVTSGSIGVDQLAGDPNLCKASAVQIRAAAQAVQLARVREHLARTLSAFGKSSDPTSVLVRQFLCEGIGNPKLPVEATEVAWRDVVQRIGRIRNHDADFSTIRTTTKLIADSGAPLWARRLRTEPTNQNDQTLPLNWRDAWDHAAADTKLAAIDARERLAKLTRNREEADKRCRKLFGNLVRERTFYALNRRLSDSIKSALIEFVRALALIGKGTGKNVGMHRAAAREAMGRCYDALPCWIMPTWRVAEQLPPELAAFDLVIIDEASQSDVTELPALLRGRKLLVVGDDRQVSPTPPFVTQAKRTQLRHHYLNELPFKNLLEPGESIYDLMRAVFPSNRLMLKEHFRCVEPIIRFSMQFYSEALLPLRVPTTQERIDPPLVDIYLPHGKREQRRKVNRAEAEVIVDEIASLVARSDGTNRTIGVISLIGAEQAEYIRGKLSDKVGEELMQRHAILCGDSATFQGTERDIVYLSMVTDPVNRTALTMSRYEQRFNVAMSRARDQVVLVRSVTREHLNPNDLKARLIAHFENPMPLEIETAVEGLGACESEFERHMMERLLTLGYRVRSQVGSLGYRIDLVVEGPDGRRLAVECDGDRFHGPAQWHEDMRRQRVLERVGWRFWRCFASSFYRDPDGTIKDLVDTLARSGVEPMPTQADACVNTRFTEHRVCDAVTEKVTTVPNVTGSQSCIRVGDKVVLLFSDNKSRLSARLTNSQHDLEKGLLSSVSALGSAVLGAEQGDEIEFEESVGRRRTALIELVESRSPLGADTETVGQGARATEPKLEGNGHVTKPVVKSGKINGGSYSMYEDGSVDVVTPSGTRHFDSLEALVSSPT